LAILAMSGDVASSPNTFGLLKWLTSWFVQLKPFQIGEINAILRKIGHATAYGMMYFLWFRALRGQQNLSAGRAFIYALGLCLVIAAADEGHQSFTRFRGGSGYDVLLDLAGACLVALMTLAFWRPRPRGTVVSGGDEDRIGGSA
jgi:VanZ family protein